MSAPTVQNIAREGTYVPIRPDFIVLLVVALVVLTAFAMASVGASYDVVNRSWSLALSPNGRYLARETDLGVALFEGESVRLVRVFRGADFSAFSPDGKTLAVAGCQNLQLWDLEKERLRNLSGRHAHALDSIGFTADGSVMVTAVSGGTAILWDVSNGKVLKEIKASARDLGYAALSPDGKTLATGEVGQGPGCPANPGPGDRPQWKGDTPAFAGHVVKLWNAESGKLLRVLEGPEYTFVRGLSFSPDGGKLAVTGPNRVWDVGTGKPLFEVDGSSGLVYNTPAFFSPDGSLVAFFHVYAERGTSVVRFHNAATGEVKHSLPIGPGFIWAASVMGEEDRVVMANGEGELTTWDLGTGKALGTVSGFTWQPVPVHWWILGGLLLAWVVAWGWVFPRQSSEPGDPERRRRRRATWGFTTAVAGVVALSAVLLHSFLFVGWGGYEIPFNLFLVQGLAGLILIGVWVKVRPALYAGILGILCVAGVAMRSIALFVEIIASI